MCQKCPPPAGTHFWARKNTIKSGYRGSEIGQVLDRFLADFGSTFSANFWTLFQAFFGTQKGGYLLLPGQSPDGSLARGPAGLPKRWPARPSQAQLCRIWTRWLLQVGLSGREVVMLNLDETAIQHEYPAGRGNVSTTARQHASGAAAFFQRVHRSATRGHTTLVGLIASDSTLQSSLPQILLPACKKRPLSRADKAAYDSLAYPIEVWEGTTGWTDGQVMRDILTRIRQAMRILRPNAVIVLVLDAASQHIGRAMLGHAARLRIYILVVPGQLTWLMQPLDTKVFGLLKRRLTAAHSLLRAASVDGTMDPVAWIHSSGAVIRDVMVGMEWGWTFPTACLSVEASGASSALSRHLGWGEDAAPRELTGPELDELIGRHRVNLTPLMFDGPRRRSLEAPPLPAPEAPPPLPGVPGLPRGLPLLGFARRAARERARAEDPAAPAPAPREAICDRTRSRSSRLSGAP